MSDRVSSYLDFCLARLEVNLDDEDDGELIPERSAAPAAAEAEKVAPTGCLSFQIA